MTISDPDLLVHLRGRGEASFNMPPKVAQATALGLSLSASALFTEVQYQGRRGALLVGPAGCGKSTWMAAVANGLVAGDTPLLRREALEPLPRDMPPDATLHLDDWDALTISQRTAQRAALEDLLQQNPHLRVLIAMRSDALAAEFDPAQWLEFQWAPVQRVDFQSHVADWSDQRLENFLEVSADPCLALLRKRPLLLTLWPQRAPAGREEAAEWLMSLSQRPDCAATVEEFQRLREAWNAPQRPLRWLPIPAGDIRIGSPDDESGRWADEAPLHVATLAAFEMNDTPVTNAQYFATLDSTDLPPWWGDARFAAPNQPVVGLSQPQALAHAHRTRASLPSETQWEYACRAGTITSRYAAPPETVARFAANSAGRLPEVASLLANDFGLYDMLGAVWEWTLDNCQPNFRNTPNDGRAFLDPQSSKHVLRGGTWADAERVVRAATRLSGHPGPRIANVGFRMIRQAASALPDIE